MLIFNKNVIIEKLNSPNDLNVELSIKREDLIHHYVSGNKFRKLYYNIESAKQNSHSEIITFGGAFSNHISATASAGKIYGIKTIGIIRGEELQNKTTLNETLNFAKECGMTLYFIDRASYKQKEESAFVKHLISKLHQPYVIPEGGTNTLAVKGCEDILNKNTKEYDYICCPVGTGGTISGIINASEPHQKVIGFSALKGDFLKEDISKFANKTNWELITDYHFGGYAKINTDLIAFINQFKTDTKIPLDPVYTGKMLFGIYDLMSKGFFKANSKILAIHTGGLQGIEGMNALLKRKKLPLIL